MNLLIIDSRDLSWSLYDANSLSLKRSGVGSVRVTPKQVERLGIIVSTLPTGEELAVLGKDSPKEAVELSHKFKGKPAYLISDSAFFRSLPVNSFTYLVGEKNFRRLGRDGLVHSSLVEAAAASLGKSSIELNLLTLYLDNDSSIAAVKEGIAIEVSSGGSSLEGLPGGKSSGSLDGDLILTLAEDVGAKKARELLTSHSGLLGFSGMKGDLDKILVKPKLRTNPKFQLAMKVYLHQLTLYLGAYSALLGKVDVVVFSGVIGEKSAFIREEIVSRLPFLKYASILTLSAKPHLVAAEVLRRQPSQLPR